MPAVLPDVVNIVGPGITHVVFGGDITSVDSKFFFYYCELTYGIQPEILVPANTVNPIFFFREPVGKVSFVEVITGSQTFSNLFNNTAINKTVDLTIFSCFGGQAERLQRITLRNVYPIEVQMKFSSENFVFLKTAIFLFFRLSLD